MVFSRLTRRTLLVSVATSAAAAALAACGGAAPTATPAPAKPAAPAPAATKPAAAPAKVNPPGGAAAPTPAPTVAPVQAAAGQTVIRYMDRNDVRYQKWMEGWIKEFEAKNSKIKIQNEPIPNDWEQKVTAALAAGAAADVIAVYGHWFRIYQEKGQLVELTSYVAKDFKPDDVKDFIPGQWNGMQLNGKQLAIPQYINVNALYVNKDAAKEAGATIPSNDYTYDQMLELATKLHKKSGDKVERYGFSTGWTADGFIRIITMIWGLGGQINPPDDLATFTFTKPETIKAFQWIHDIPWKHKVGALTAADMGGLNGGQAFWGGKLGSLFEGIHLFAVIPEGLKMEWDVLPPPKGPGGRGQRNAMDGFIIARNSKTPDLAWEVVRDTSSVEANKQRAKATLLYPARKSAGGAWLETFPGKNVKAAVADTMDEARPDPRSLWKNAAPTWNAIKPINEQLFIVNKVTVEEAMQKMQAAAEKAQKEG